SQGIAQAVEGIGLDDDRMIKPGIVLGAVGDHVDEIHPAERAREIGRLLQIGLFLRSAEFPVRRLGLARHAPALSSVLRRRNRLRAVGPKQILHQPPLGPGLDFGQRLPDCEQRRGFAARDEVAARRLGLTARERSDRRALHDFLSEQEAPERATLGVLKLDQCTGARHLALRLEQLQANALALGQGFALNDLQLGELHEKRRDAIGVGGEAGALAHAPAGLAAREVQLAARVGNCDLGDLAQAQARDRLLPRTRIGARPGRAVGQHDGGTRGGEDREHRERDEELPAVHIAGVLRRRRIARPMPASVTRRGISAMLPLRGITIRCPKISWICTAAPSLMKSLSPTSTTAFSPADSLSCAASGFDSEAFAAFFSPLSSSLGRPSGNAVLNLPVSRTARGYSVPEGLNARMAASPCAVAANESTSWEYAELFIRTASLRPSAGLPVNAPSK